MDEKSKGISLRKKRSVRPTISAPKQISAPLPSGLSAGQSTQSRPTANDGGLPTGPRPRERPQNGDRTADLVKRRYSTRFAQLPQDYNGGDAPPMPTVPSIPSQFAVQPPTQDGQERSGQRIRVDTKSLRDPSLQPEQCMLSKSINSYGRCSLSPQTSQIYFPMPPRPISQTSSKACAKSRTALPPTCNRMCFRTARSSSRSAKRPRNSSLRCGRYETSCRS
jgi:hypothetical protein